MTQQKKDKFQEGFTKVAGSGEPRDYQKGSSTPNPKPKDKLVATIKPKKALVNRSVKNP